MSAYELRPFQDEDLESLLETWHLVFAHQAGEQALTREVWEWKYRRNPAGMRVWVAVRDGQVVGHYAGMPHTVWLSGREVVFTEVVDSMIHPDHRAGLKRPGLFVELARRMLDTIGGPDKDFACYGWPIHAAWRIGRRFLEYDLCRTQSLLAREVGPGATELPEGVERIDRFDHTARWLWERCCGAWGASTIRDETFLDWRFLRHPRRRYTLLVTRDAAGVPSGFVALFVGKWVLPRQAVIVDWLVPTEEEGAAARLIEASLAVARAEGAPVLATLLVEWSPWYDRLQRGGFRVYPSDLVLATRPYTRKFDVPWLRNHWWYTLGDSDQV